MPMIANRFRRLVDKETVPPGVRTTYIAPPGMENAPEWFWIWFFDFYGITPADPQKDGAVFPTQDGVTPQVSVKDSVPVAITTPNILVKS